MRVCVCARACVRACMRVSDVRGIQYYDYILSLNFYVYISVDLVRYGATEMTANVMNIMIIPILIINAILTSSRLAGQRQGLAGESSAVTIQVRATASVGGSSKQRRRHARFTYHCCKQIVD